MCKLICTSGIWTYKKSPHNHDLKRESIFDYAKTFRKKQDFARILHIQVQGIKVCLYITQ